MSRRACNTAAGRRPPRRTVMPRPPGPGDPPLTRRPAGSAGARRCARRPPRPRERAQQVPHLVGDRPHPRGLVGQPRADLAFGAGDGRSRFRTSSACRRSRSAAASIASAAASTAAQSRASCRRYAEAASDTQRARAPSRRCSSAAARTERARWDSSAANASRAAGSPYTPIAPPRFLNWSGSVCDRGSPGGPTIEPVDSPRGAARVRPLASGG